MFSHGESTISLPKTGKYTKFAVGENLRIRHRTLRRIERFKVLGEKIQAILKPKK